MEYWLETIAMNGALHFGGYLLLDGKSEEWLLVFRKADAFGRILGLIGHGTSNSGIESAASEVGHYFTKHLSDILGSSWARSGD